MREPKRIARMTAPTNEWYLKKANRLQLLVVVPSGFALERKDSLRRRVEETTCRHGHQVLVKWTEAQKRSADGIQGNGMIDTKRPGYPDGDRIRFLLSRRPIKWKS